MMNSSAPENYTSFPYSCLAGYNITEYAAELEQRHRSDQFHQLYWLKLPLAITGTILVTIFIASIVRSMRDRRVGRKFYALILNRACGDLSYMLFFLVGYVAGGGNADYQSRMSTIILSTGAYWAAMVSYVSLSLLKLYGIANPLQYRNKVTMGLCLRIIGVSWLAFFLLVGVAFSTQALLHIPTLRQWSRCSEHTCLGYVNRVINAFIALLYAITLTCYGFTVAYIWRANQTTKTLQSNSSRRKEANQKRGISNSPPALPARKSFLGGLGIPLFKLSLNVATFALFHLPHTLAALFVAVSSPRFKFVSLICFAHTSLHAMQLTMGVIGVCLMLRIITDVLVGFTIDKEIRRSLLLWLMCGHKGKACYILPRLLTRRGTTTTMSGSGSASAPPATELTHVSGGGSVYVAVKRTRLHKNGSTRN